jgi:hypothetical protein
MLTVSLAIVMEPPFAAVAAFVRGEPALGKLDVIIEPDDYAPMQKATVFFDAANKKAYIKASKTTDSSALLGEYMTSILIPHGFPKGMSGQYQAVYYSLGAYFPASCLNTSPPAGSSTPWPETGHVMDWRKAYSSMLWDVRDRVSAPVLDRSLVRAWLDLQPSYQDSQFASLFSKKLVGLLGTSAGSQAAAVFKTRGMPTVE